MIRKIFFNFFFSEQEKTAIINALYRRKNDFSTSHIDGDEYIRNKCGEIAQDLMS